MTVVYALFAVYMHRKDLIAVFATNALAVQYGEKHKLASWHVQEVTLFTE